MRRPRRCGGTAEHGLGHVRAGDRRAVGVLRRHDEAERRAEIRDRREVHDLRRLGNGAARGAGRVAALPLKLRRDRRVAVEGAGVGGELTPDLQRSRDRRLVDGRRLEVLLVDDGEGVVREAGGGARGVRRSDVDAQREADVRGRRHIRALGREGDRRARRQVADRVAALPLVREGQRRRAEPGAGSDRERLADDVLPLDRRRHREARRRRAHDVRRRRRLGPPRRSSSP